MNNHNLLYEILSLSKFYFLMFLGIVKYDNEFKTKENKIWTKDKIEPHHLHISSSDHTITIMRLCIKIQPNTLHEHYTLNVWSRGKQLVLFSSRETSGLEEKQE